VQTGKLLHQNTVDQTPGPRTGRSVRQQALPDILSLEGDAIWMRGLGVDKSLNPVADRPHLFAPRGFLDDAWWHRTYWLYGTAMRGGYGGWPLAGNAAPAGRLLVCDGGDLIYGYGRMSYREGRGHVRPDATKDYRLFAEVCSPKPEQKTDARGEIQEVPGGREIKWTARVPFVVRSIVLANDALLIAGGQSLTDGGRPGTFWIASREDGSKQTACELPAAPILDGMALTDAGVFVSTEAGSVVCLKDAREE